MAAEGKMKKKLSIVMAVLLAVMMVLTACGGAGGGNSKEQKIKSAIDGFMGAIKSGEYDKIKDYTTENAVDAEAFKNLNELDQYINSFGETLGIDPADLPEDAVKQLHEFVDNLKASFVKSYEIGEITEEEDKATVPVKVTFGFDFEAVGKLDMDEELKAMMTDYISTNMGDLMEIFAAEGKKGMNKKIVTDLLGDILKIVSDAFSGTGESVKDVTFELEEQEDGEWLISKVKGE